MEVPRVQCPRCRAENRDEARFCRECGTTFSSACATVEPGSRFCDGCGAPLAAASRPPSMPSHLASPESYTPKHLAEKILTSKTALEGERTLAPSPNAALLNAEPALRAYLAERFAAVGPPPVVAGLYSAVAVSVVVLALGQRMPVNFAPRSIITVLFAAMVPDTIVPAVRQDPANVDRT